MQTTNNKYGVWMSALYRLSALERNPWKIHTWSRVLLRRERGQKPCLDEGDHDITHETHVDYRDDAYIEMHDSKVNQ
eukprot:g56624.t1